MRTPCFILLLFYFYFSFIAVVRSALVVTAEALPQANIDWKSAILKMVNRFRPNFHMVATYPANCFCTNR